MTAAGDRSEAAESFHRRPRPNSFTPAELQTQFLVYVISFIVLGLRWMSLASSRACRRPSRIARPLVAPSPVARDLRASSRWCRTLRCARAGDLALLRNHDFGALVALLWGAAETHIGRRMPFAARGLDREYSVALTVAASVSCKPKHANVDLPAEHLRAGGAPLCTGPETVKHEQGQQNEPALLLCRQGAVPKQPAADAGYRGAIDARAP